MHKEVGYMRLKKKKGKKALKDVCWTQLDLLSPQIGLKQCGWTFLGAKDHCRPQRRGVSAEHGGSMRVP